jgi:hypothetical protein
MGPSPWVLIVSLEILFPRLASEGFVETSSATAKYNCIAWAAGRTDDWWWPDPLGNYPWPEGVPRTVSIEAFCQAFETLGYMRCEHGDFEPGFEKVAIYSLNGLPTHAARQLPGGQWTSKLGKEIDITHALTGLEGPIYGQVVGYLKRPRTGT